MKTEEYYRRYGIKTSERLKSPDFRQAGVFTLPHHTVLVYLPHDDLTLGPSMNWAPLVGVEEDISVSSLKQLTVKEQGKPNNIRPLELQKEYHGRNRRLNKMRKLETASRNKSTVLVENYAFLRKECYYSKSYARIWRASMNTFLSAFTDVVKEMQLLPERVFLLPLESPNKSFTKTEFDLVSVSPNQTWLETFDTSEAILMGYLYQYLLKADLILKQDSSLEEDKEFLNNPWSKFPLGATENLWLLPQGGDSLAVVSLHRLLEIVSKNGIAAFIHLTNAIHELVTNLADGADLSEEEITFDADGKVKRGGEANEVAGLETPEQKALHAQIKAKAAKGGLSNREVAHLTKLAAKPSTILAPDGKQTLNEFAKITKEDLAIIPKPLVPVHPLAGDARYQRNTNVEMVEQYTQRLMQKDIIRTILSVQKAGVFVTDLKYEKRIDGVGAKHYYVVSLATADGATSKWHIDIPVVEDDGSFTLNGTEVFFTPQRSDVPIRKVKPHQVKLTSYDGSCFITRGRLTKMDYDRWLLAGIREKVNVGEITVRTRKVNDTDTVYPRIYTLLGSEYSDITYGDYTFKLNAKDREAIFGKDVIKRLERKDHIVVGRKKKNLVTVDSNEVFWEHPEKGGPKELGLVEEILDLDIKKRNLDAVEVKIYSKQVPIGIVLGQRIGFTYLLAKLKPTYRVFTTGERGNTIDTNEYAVEFADKTYVFNITDRQATLVFNSFNIYKKHIKNYNVSDFDKPDVYLSVLSDVGLGLRYFSEIDNGYDLFLDPITIDALTKMGEPTDLTSLYFRATELLTTNNHPHEIDPDFMRDRHYERFSGFIYKSQTDAIRVQRSRPPGSKAPISIAPHEVIANISKDNSKNMVESSNVQRSIREKSFISYAGEGGRTAQTMTPELRIFHQNELGHTSVDNTADSGKVALNSTRVHNPIMEDLRGFKGTYDPKIHDESNLFTTNAITTAGVDRDELKRLNFLSTQGDSVYPIPGYIPAPLHTPAEYSLSHQGSHYFSTMAKEDGKVISVSDIGIRVLYKSGVEEGIEIGRKFGRVAGTIIPHEIVTDLKQGNRFKAGDPLAWNNNTFVRDLIEPNILAYKSVRIVPTVFVESPATFEDSVSMCESIKDDYKVNITKEYHLPIPFTTEVQKMVKVGDVLDEQTPICVQIPEHLQGTDYSDNATLEKLKELGKDSPVAGVEGIVERIEVYYFGIKDDMHPTLKTLANASDKARRRLITELGKENISENGMVSSAVAFGGTKIERNQVVLKLFITKNGVPLVSGSKTVSGAQLKNTINEIMPEPITFVESDEIAEGYFSYNGQNNRIVLSMLEQGLGNRSLCLLTKDVIKTYRGE